MAVWYTEGGWFNEGGREIFRGSALDMAARLDVCQQALERIGKGRDLSLLDAGDEYQAGYEDAENDVAKIAWGALGNG